MINKWRRIIRLDQEIRAKTYPSTHKMVDILLDEWGETVTERTIFDDVARLRDELRAPIVFNEERGGYEYIDATYVLPAIYVTEGELLGLFVGHEIVQQYAGTPFEAPLRSAIEKIVEYVPGQVMVDLNQAKDYFTFAPGATIELKSGLIDDLHHAIRDRKKCR